MKRIHDWFLFTNEQTKEKQTKRRVVVFGTGGEDIRGNLNDIFYKPEKYNILDNVNKYEQNKKN